MEKRLAGMRWMGNGGKEHPGAQTGAQSLPFADE
jgi:hypothetical protein